MIRQIGSAKSSVQPYVAIGDGRFVASSKIKDSLNGWQVPRPGMLAFVLGVALFDQLQQFTGVGVLSLALGLIPFAMGCPSLRPLAGFILGLGCASAHAHIALVHRLPTSLDRSLIVVEGRIESILSNTVVAPAAAGNTVYAERRASVGSAAASNLPPSVRFTVLAERVLPTSDKRARTDNAKHGRISSAALGRLHGCRIKTRWYKPSGYPRGGERWRMTLRLRTVSGTLNFHGSDSSRRSFGDRLCARATVYATPAPERLAFASWWSITGLRQHIGDFVLEHIATPDAAAVAQALVIGHRGGFSAELWDTLAATGTSHLVAISGLHVGLVAMVLLWLSRATKHLCTPCYAFWETVSDRVKPSRHRFPGRSPGARTSSRNSRRRSRTQRDHHTITVPVRNARPIEPGPILALIGATAYALLAGFGVPVQRALIMLGVYFLARASRRASSSWNVFVLALFLVVFFDPLSVASPGLWMSFAAVAALIMLHQLQSQRDSSAWRVRQMMVLQLRLSLFLLPLVMLLFGNQAVSAPFANLVGIPLLSLIVVPLLLLTTILSALHEVLAGHLLAILETLLQLYLRLLIWFSSWPMLGIAKAPDWRTILLCVAALGAFSGLFCCGNRLLCALFAMLWISPLFLAPAPRPAQGDFWVDVFDVGQGLAVLVRTARHNLLYDTGFGIPGGFDSGRSVVLPQLLGHGIAHLDAVILSHSHADHSGGYLSVLRHFSGHALISNHRPSALHPIVCVAGMRWNWGEVQFELLHPVDTEGVGNNDSCVLKVSMRRAVSAGAQSSGALSILLPGDVEHFAEARLLGRYADRLQSEVLIVPHHGSRTSSSEAFVRAVQPRLAVVSAGFGNRFGHPSAQVMARLHRMGIRTLMTSIQGGLALRFESERGLRIRSARWARRRYWHQMPARPDDKCGLPCLALQTRCPQEC